MNLENQGILDELPMAMFECIANPCALFDEIHSVVMWRNRPWQLLIGSESAEIRQIIAAICQQIPDDGHYKTELELWDLEHRLQQFEILLQRLNGCVLLMILTNGTSSGSASFAGTIDPLTGIPDRSNLMPALKKALTNSLPAQDFALLFIDLDSFKAVNDQYGHLIGDAVLREVALRLSAAIRSNDLMTRFGGDEFVALISPLNASSDLDKVRSRINRVIASPLTTGQLTINISVSIGAAMGSEGWQSPEEMIAAADLRMYESKQIRR